MDLGVQILPDELAALVALIRDMSDRLQAVEGNMALSPVDVAKINDRAFANFDTGLVDETMQPLHTLVITLVRDLRAHCRHVRRAVPA